MASNNLGLTADRQNLPAVHPAIRIASVARPVFTDHRPECLGRLARNCSLSAEYASCGQSALAYQTLPKRSGSPHLRAENWRSGVRASETRGRLLRGSLRHLHAES